MTAPPRLVLGVMTGTSLDAIDAALVRIEGQGLAMRARPCAAATTPLRDHDDLAAPLRALAQQQPMAAGDIARLARRFSLAVAGACVELLTRSRASGAIDAGERPALACVHGQTVFHAPPDSWQLLAPAVIARAVGAPVVFDLRAADLAAGGQGAPITPLADWVLFRDEREHRAVANLGGFCNVTMLPSSAGGEASGPAGAVTGRDVCACNHVLDTIARRCLGTPFDEGGAAAARGRIDDDALDDLLGLFAAQHRAARSLGTGDEVVGWVGRHRARLDGADLCATACEALAQTIARATLDAERLIVAGGGARNAALVRAITSASAARVVRSDELGVDAAYREAVAMAVLGALCQDRVPITLPRVTGVPAPAPVAGAWVYP